MLSGQSNYIIEKSSLDDSVEVFRKKITTSTEIDSKSYKPKRVAAYCRVSKNIELQQTSLETQIDSYQRTIAERVDWQLVEIYYDRGITGTNASRRPGFMKMIEDCKAGKIDLILAKSISRFARNTVDMLEYTRMLKRIGVSVYFEKERIDTGDLTSEMLLTVYAAFAQEESHSISENTRRGYRQRFQMGIPKYNKVYGYRSDVDDKNIWFIEESEASVIREIFHRYLRGERIQKICDDFNARGIPSPNGDTWYQTSMGMILKNEKYVGDVTMQKTVVTDLLNHVSKPNKGLVPIYRKKNHHEAIISRDDYETVQRMLVLKDVHHGSQQYPYYDYLKCPHCGAQMVQFMTNLPNAPTAWICKDHKTCRHNAILTKYINRTVIKAINELPSCLSGYEDAIRDAKENFARGGSVELYFLKKLIEKIEISEDYESIKITFKFGKEHTEKLKFDRPSEHPNPIIEYKGNRLFINGRFFQPREGLRVTECITKVQLFNKNVDVYLPDGGDGVFRIDNSKSGRSNWKKRFDAKEAYNAETAQGEVPICSNESKLNGIDIAGKRTMHTEPNEPF